MPVIEMTEQEWNQVMAILSSAPWRDANPLLIKIGSQLQPQTRPPAPAQTPTKGNSKEARHE
jgi:hypothetical protein